VLALANVLDLLFDELAGLGRGSLALFLVLFCVLEGLFVGHRSSFRAERGRKNPASQALAYFVWRRSDGTEMEMRGTYREIVPPDRLVSTESWGGDWPETLNTLLLLSERDGKTTVTNTVRYPPKEARDAALKTGMTEGVSESFDRLEELLRTMA
jgi:uncharacterized protein YndB with AHSA1/START domain